MPTNSLQKEQHYSQLAAYQLEILIMWLQHEGSPLRTGTQLREGRFVTVLASTEQSCGRPPTSACTCRHLQMVRIKPRICFLLCLRIHSSRDSNYIFPQHKPWPSEPWLVQLAPWTQVNLSSASEYRALVWWPKNQAIRPDASQSGSEVRFSILGTQQEELRKQEIACLGFCERDSSAECRTFGLFIMRWQVLHRFWHCHVGNSASSGNSEIWQGCQRYAA